MGDLVENGPIYGSDAGSTEGASGVQKEEPSPPSLHGSKPWERPWSVDEMRQNAGNWSLAGDAGMLQYLQDFSHKMMARTHKMQEQLDGLVHESKLTGVRVNNAFNDFIMLANTQFVENRVYDEEVVTEETEAKKNEEKEKTKEEREAMLIPRISTAIKLGLDVIDNAFEKLDVNAANSDSEDEEESGAYPSEPILEPKDPYLNRPLPHLIGTTSFYEDDDIGLLDSPSDNEVEDQGSVSESESEESEESESEEEETKEEKVTNNMQQNNATAFSDSESESGSELFGGKSSGEEKLSSTEDEEEEDEKDSATKDTAPAPPAGPANFADELAAKLGGGTQQTEQPMGKKKKKSEAKKKKVPTATLR